jgi:hypothetical protein
MDHSQKCACGARAASFNFKDSLLPNEVITGLYCPECASGAAFNPATMLRDNGWVLAYDMEVARFMLSGQAAAAGGVTPELIFDEGYCTWRGISPTDPADAVREREAIVKLAKTDPKKYFEELKTWGLKRMERFAREGWRKAREGAAVS